MFRTQYIRYGFIQLSCMAMACLSARAQITVTLKSSLSAPQPVGVPVLWTATVSPAGGSLLYRFSTSAAAGMPSIVRDYSPLNTLPWTTLKEGAYTIQVNVTDTVSGASAQAQMPFLFTARTKSGAAPVVSRTPNPLVALYSAPPCAAGTVQVSFWPANGAEPAMQTSPQACNGKMTLNFHIAGMLPNTAYTIQQQLTNNGVSTPGPLLSFQTGVPLVTLPAMKMIHAADGNTSTQEGILLTSFVSNQRSLPAATDLSGKLLWYYVNSQDPLNYSPFVTRTTSSPSVLLLFLQGSNRRQVLREVDLAGNLVRETCTNALNAQLAGMGKDILSWLSHEAFRLPNGHTLVLGSTERLLNNVQGAGNVDVIGDLILDLDENFQVAWTWDAFDFLDASRMAILGETCTSGQTCGGPLRLAQVANDWTHCNSLDYLTGDGSLVLSCRNQDWVLKINYAGGSGDGSVLWRLGAGGDFSILSTDPWPWFSHQHDVGFDGTNYGMFDDGNTRVQTMKGGNSRGYVLSVDETSMTATPILLADLGAFSQWWGSAQLLSNGNYHFLSGCLGAGGKTVYNCIFAPGTKTDQSIEVLPDGTLNYNVLWNALAYRSFRMKDLYTPAP